MLASYVSKLALVQRRTTGTHGHGEVKTSVGGSEETIDSVSDAFRMRNAELERSRAQLFLSTSPSTVMFALRAWRSSLLATTRRPTLIATFQTSSSQDATNEVNQLIDDLQSTTPVAVTAQDEAPPMAGAEGYATPRPSPFRRKDIEQFKNAYIKARYRLHCHSTSNNTIVTLTTSDGMPVAWASGGLCGFKKANRGSYEAGHKCAIRMFQKIREINKHEPLEVDLFFKGFGQGRDALYRALMTSEGQAVRLLVSTMTDRTAIKIGGTRAKKARRL